METFHNLYVHFPYCETKCHYCDFFSLPESKFDERDRARVYSAILNELDQYQVEEIDTLFMGGGTPSLVPTEVIEKFFAKLKLTAKSEVTMEANPSSITFEKAKEWKRIGVRRISMGVQALDDERLAWLGRVHSKQKAFDALDALFKAGIEAVSIDYIVGVPDQTVEKIHSEISDVLKRFPNIKHLSAYLLTLQKANPKCKQLPSEETQLAHLHAVRDVLAEHGFEQYEISNFSKPGSRARHNENYWLGGSYLGIGPSAHSFHRQDSKRVKNWASLGKYVEEIEAKRVAAEWSETLDLEQQRIEFIMLRLRRAEGLNLKQYQTAFSTDLLKDRESLIEGMMKKNLCRIEDQFLRLTAEGFFLSDQIFSKLV